MCVKLPNFEYSVPFLIDKGLALLFHAKAFATAVENIITDGSKLAADLSGVHDDYISVHGLIGVNMLKYMGAMHLIHFMNRSAFKFPQGIVPFDDVKDFLSPVVHVLVVSTIIKLFPHILSGL